MKTNILIPATLTTTTCLRVFLFDEEAEIKHQYSKTHYDCDIPLMDGRQPSHHFALSLLKKYSKRPKKKVGYHHLDGFGPTIRAHGLNELAGFCCEDEAIFAYQFVEVTTISDDRSKFRHENSTTKRTSKILSKKVFIYGKKVKMKKAKGLAKWVGDQMKLASHQRDLEGFGERGVSAYTSEGFKLLTRRERRLSEVIKLGSATFAGFDPKKVEFKPLKK